MRTMAAYMMGQMNRNNRVKVFDWDKAARLIRERGAREARAGLAGDWEWTGGAILKVGFPVAQHDTYTYLSSTWATPEIEIDGILEDCWCWQDDSPGWDEHTYWPESAKALLCVNVVSDAPERRR